MEGMESGQSTLYTARKTAGLIEKQEEASEWPTMTSNDGYKKSFSGKS